MMEELQRIFRAAMPAQIAALQDARAEGVDGAERVRRIAHTLRGSGGTYGFPEISAAAAAVEFAEPQELDARVERLLELLRATC